jgi:hypothetical protein
MPEINGEPRLLIPALKPFYDRAIPLSWAIVRFAVGWPDDQSLSLPFPPAVWLQSQPCRFSLRVPRAFPGSHLCCGRTRLRGWACRTRTQKCRRKLSL